MHALKQLSSVQRSDDELVKVEMLISFLSRQCNMEEIFFKKRTL